MKPMTEEHLAMFRRHMAEVIDMHFDLAEDEIGTGAMDATLKRAVIDVPRHLFVPQGLALMAYQDTPLPIGFDKTISQPFIGALMIQLLDVGPGMRVLEVGTGLGYQAALMAEMGAEVFGVEVVEEFAEAAETRFAALGYDIPVRVGDGARGRDPNAPFDRILVTAAALEPPRDLLAQLKPGGRMVIPLGGSDVQQLSIVSRNEEGDTSIRNVMPVRFTQLEIAAG